MLDPAAVEAAFAARYGRPPSLIVRAPGRVNLMGDHTDYNDGFVFPMALDRAVYVAAHSRSDRVVRAFATRFDEEDSFALAAIARSDQRPWSNYVRGVVKALLAREPALSGADLLIDSDVPIGGGLSSSAALEVAVGFAFQSLNGIALRGEELALLTQEAENTFVGMRCGIMDQFIATLGQAGHALLIDCRDLSYRAVPLPSDVRVVVIGSRVPRALTASAYNRRRAECDEAVRRLRPALPHIAALRDVTPSDLARLGATLPPIIHARARHVVSENARVLEGAAALEHGDAAAFGALMNTSHASLRDDYAVSIPELDHLVAVAQAAGCYGARLTGAGFGGCMVGLVDADAVSAFVAAVTTAYRRETGREATAYVCRAADGVRRIASAA